MQNIRRLALYLAAATSACLTAANAQAQSAPPVIRVLPTAANSTAIETMKAFAQNLEEQTRALGIYQPTLNRLVFNTQQAPPQPDELALKRLLTIRSDFIGIIQQRTSAPLIGSETVIQPLMGTTGASIRLTANYIPLQPTQLPKALRLHTVIVLYMLARDACARGQRKEALDYVSGAREKLGPQPSAELKAVASDLSALAAILKSSPTGASH